jgi:hypothetical protein
VKHSVLVLFLVACCFAGCGKVGDPRPPAIRIPVKIGDLKATQSQYDVVLSWTNPSKYVDGSTATDLVDIRILRDGSRIATVKVSAPGKPQTTTLDVHGAAGTAPVYTLEVATLRGKVSDASNPAHIAIVDVPGAILNLKGAMDQHRIRLDWQPPASAAALADVYVVRREDGAVAASVVKETWFEDANIEPGKTYSYIVTAAHGSTSPVPGPPSSPILVVAVDKVAPVIPTGLQPPVVTDTGAILQWNMNAEVDLAGYRVYRSDNPDSGFTRLDGVIHALNSIRDENYRPGSYYEVSAEDIDGNESPRSAAVRGP